MGREIGGMGIKGLRQGIDVHLEHIFRGILGNALELAFIATGEPGTDIFQRAVIESHGQDGIFQLPMPDGIQLRFIGGPGRIFAVHHHGFLVVKSQRIQIILDGIEELAQACFQTLLEAVENGVTGFQLASAQLVVQLIAIALEFADIRGQEILPIGVQILEIAVENLAGEGVVKLQSPVVMLQLYRKLFS